MALLNILRYPDPRLYKKAARVLEVDESVRDPVQLVRAKALQAASGLGFVDA